MRVYVFIFYVFINDVKECDVFIFDGINLLDGDVIVVMFVVFFG